MDLTSLLEGFAADPWTYIPLLLVFSVAATVLLPIPEEVGLLNPFIPWYYLVLTLAIGKSIGALLIFPAGARLEREIARWVVRFPWLERWFAGIQRGVARYGYAALFGLLSVPMMTDTVPVYAFSILNPSGSGHRLRLLPFTAVNFAAGALRGTAFLLLPLYFGWK